jgi:hypothetical protein
VIQDPQPGEYLGLNLEKKTFTFQFAYHSQQSEFSFENLRVDDSSAIILDSILKYNTIYIVGSGYPNKIGGNLYIVVKDRFTDVKILVQNILYNRVTRKDLYDVETNIREGCFLMHRVHVRASPQSPRVTASLYNSHRAEYHDRYAWYFDEVYAEKPWYKPTKQEPFSFD